MATYPSLFDLTKITRWWAHAANLSNLTCRHLSNQAQQGYFYIYVFDSDHFNIVILSTATMPAFVIYFPFESISSITCHFVTS